MIKSVRSTSGEKSPNSKVWILLHEEWKFMFRYMQWLMLAYGVTEGESNVEQSRIRTAYNDLNSVLLQREQKRKVAVAMEEEKKSTTSSAGVKKMKKGAGKNTSHIDIIGFESTLSGIKNMQKRKKSADNILLEEEEANSSSDEQMMKMAESEEKMEEVQ